MERVRRSKVLERVHSTKPCEREAERTSQLAWLCRSSQRQLARSKELGLARSKELVLELGCSKELVLDGSKELARSSSELHCNDNLCGCADERTILRVCLFRHSKQVLVHSSLELVHSSLEQRCNGSP